MKRERQWKPGDVARIQGNGMDTVAIRTAEDSWVWVDRRGRNPIKGVCLMHADGDSGRSIRPLVVIDPEDRESARHLLAEFCCAVDASDIPAHPQGWSIDAMQAALREFADPKPPKCGAVLILAGADFPCDLDADHDGLAHSSRDAEAIWGERK